MTLHKTFRLGAEALARGNFRYGALHREYGFSQTDWDLLTKQDHWTAEEARQARGIIAAAIEVCLSLGGLPAVPLPGQYAAAVIAILVSPANRMIAAMKAPDTFDAVAASGLQETVQIRPTPKEQMIALVMAYSGGLGGEPIGQVLPIETSEYVKKENKK